MRVGLLLSAPDSLFLQAPAAPARSSWFAPLERAGRFLWVAPLTIALAIVAVYPTIFLVALSLSKSRLGKPFRAFEGFSNFSASLTDPEFLASLMRSALFALGSSAVEISLGLSIAALFASLVKARRVLMSFVLLPLMTPPIAVGVAWRLMLAPAGGLLNGWLSHLGLTDAPISFLAGPIWPWISIGVADAWQWTPFVAILCYAAIVSLPADVYDAAALDGASPWQRFRYVTLPLLAPALSAILLLKVVIGFKLFDLVLALTFGGPGFATTTAGFHIWRRALEQFDVGRASAETLIFAVVVGIVTIPVAWLHRRASRIES